MQGDAINVEDEGANKVTAYKVMRGEADVTDSYTFGNPVDGKLTIDPRPVTFTGESATRFYTSQEINLTGVSTNDGDNTGLVEGHASNVTASAKGINAGTYPGAITASRDVVIKHGTDDVTKNYAVTTEPGTLIIAAAPIADFDIQLTPKDVVETYNGTAWPAGTATAQAPTKDTLKVEYSAPGVEWTDNPADISATNVSDSTTVQIRVSGANFAGYVTGTQTLTVKPAPVTVTANPATKLYGEKDPTFTATLNGLVNNEPESLIAYTVTRPGAGTDENVGTYANAIVTAGAAEQGNYTVAYAPADFAIAPSDANAIVATGVTKSYDGQEAYIAAVAAQLGSTIEYSMNDGQTWTAVNPTFTDVGANTVQVRATNPNFETVTASAEVVINPVPVTVTANSFTKVVGAADPGLTYTFTNAVNGETPNFTGALEREVGEDVGSYAINQGTLVLADDNGRAAGTTFKASNYTMVFVAGTLTITPVAVPPTPATPPATPTPTAPPAPAGPAVPPGTVPPDDPIAPIIAPIVEALEDAATPLAGPQEQEIADNENPLAGFDRVSCWVHYYLILGIILTVLYGAGVLARRIAFARKLKKREDEVLGIGSEGAAAPAAPVAAEGKEA